jgi:DNA-binding GntR family transcriptional regulator
MTHRPPRTGLVHEVKSRVLDMLKELQTGGRCPPEAAMAAACGVSRTTLRAALQVLEQDGVLASGRRPRTLARRVSRADYPAEAKPVERLDRRAARHLIERLSSGVIRPGEFLSERTVAASLGCSIAPVREAFLSLAPLGLFHKQSRQRWRAVSLDEAQIGELMELRQVIEGFCMQKLFKSGLLERHLPALGIIYKDTRSLARKRLVDPAEFIDVDIRFHRWLLDSSENRLLIERHQFVHALIEFQLRNPKFDSERAKLGLAQHMGIMEAIRAGDARAARRLLRGHMATAVETLRKIR